jgi:hypothetical protein
VRQAAALQDLQKRFMQQEHQLEAATASSATTADSEQVQVENYFPEAKVQLELSMLHKVEAQIESVSKTIDEARKAMPLLTAEQQAVQVRGGCRDAPLLVPLLLLPACWSHGTRNCRHQPN